MEIHEIFSDQIITYLLFFFSSQENGRQLFGKCFMSAVLLSNPM